MINGALQAQQGLRPSALRSIGARANGLQQRPAARPAARRLPRVAMAAAEAADVVEEQPAAAVPEAAAAPQAAEAADAAPARFPRKGGNNRRGPQKPRYGPDRTMQVGDLEIGRTYEGNVVSVTDFGAFVNVGCATDGLLHISQISVEFVRNVADAVTIGQPISVRVLSVDTDRKKFAVSAIPEGQEPPRRGERNNRWEDDAGGDSAGRQEPPRQARAQKQRRANRTPCPVAAGDVVTGPISSVAPFGIFIDLGDGHTGMLHSSQMKLPEGVQDHMRHYNVGDSVEVRVSSIGRGGDKVALTQKSDAEIAAEEETRTRGLAAVSDLPEGSGSMAYMLARAGVKSSDFNAQQSEKAEEKAAPVEEVPAPAPVEAAAPAPAPVVEEEAAAAAAPAAAKEEKAAPAPAAGISAAVVKTLREASGAGMMDCKKALTECGGDLEAAKEFLRKKGLASADKKSSRVAAEGAIGSYIHAGSRLGVLVEVNCETDFVARGEKFRELVSDMAMQIAACPDVKFVSASDVPAAVLEKERAIEMEKEDLKSKPEAIREKIVQGRVDKIAKEFALLEQPFIKDTNKTVAEHIKGQIAAIGENMQVRRFDRFVLGEGIEVAAKGDFAAEVEAQTSAMAAKAAEKKEEKVEEKADDKPAAAAVPAVAISAAAVKQLREASGAGMMDCKKALAECGGDLETAKEYLRKKGLASADKKSSRVASEGAIGSYIHAGSRLGVVVEVNCETDFVARGEKFRELVSDMAMQIAACPDVKFVSASDVPAAVLEKERAIEMEKEDLKSKPEAIREKIVQGRVDKIAKEFALLEQPFIKDTNKTVAEHIKEQVAAIGENMQVRRFGRFVLGEGVEKKEVDFAAEVAAQTGGKL